MCVGRMLDMYVYAALFLFEHFVDKKKSRIKKDHSFDRKKKDENFDLSINFRHTKKKHKWRKENEREVII